MLGQMTETFTDQQTADASLVVLGGNPTPPPGYNALFAWQPPSDRPEQFRSPFPKTNRITLDPASQCATRLEVVSGPGARVLTFNDRRTKCCAYLWGRAAHRRWNSDQLLPRLVDAVIGRRPADLSDLIGTFVALVDDRLNGQVAVVTDALGLQPFFVGSRAGAFAGGSDVWAIGRAGLCGSRLNYDAVSSWLLHGYECGDDTLMQDLHRPAPAAITYYRGASTTPVRYHRPIGGEARPQRTEIADAIHDNVSQAFDLLTADIPDLNIALSGGFDSRLVAAMSKRKLGDRARATVVKEIDSDAFVAERVAQTLKMPLEVINTDGSRWNIYDEPFGFSPAGFPITKQVSWVVANKRPGVPLISGFLGDSLVRGSADRRDGKLDRETTEDLTVVQSRHRQAANNRLDLLDPAFARRCEDRAISVLRRMTDAGTELGKPNLYLSLYLGHRCYLANNFTQHFDISEAVMPFHLWNLVDLRFRNEYDCFTWETYDLLFRRHYPALADIPHNQRSDIPNQAKAVPSRRVRQWAGGLLGQLANPQCLPIVNRRKTIPRLAGAWLGRRDVQDVSIFLRRLYLLEQRARQGGIEFDWNKV